MDDADIITLGWLRKQALKALLAFGLIIIAATWRLSAQATELQRDVQTAKAVLPQVAQLTEEVRLLRKGQDSLVTLMTERERR